MKTMKESLMMSRAAGARAESKWTSKLNEVNMHLRRNGQKPMTAEKRSALARVLESTQEYIGYTNLTEASQNFSPAGFSNNPTLAVGPYKRYAIDIIAAMVPSLIAFDCVSVQPIDNKVGIVNYVKYSAGSKKAGYDPSNPNINNTFADTFNYYGSDKNYTAQYTGEEILTMIQGSAATAQSTTLAWHPILINEAPINIKIGGTVIGKVNQNATLNGSVATITPVTNSVATITAGTVDVMTGVMQLTFSADPTTALANGVTADYVYDNQWAPAAVPEINLSIESVMIQAVSRKLKALWSFDASFELMKEYGQDMNALLAAQAAGEIAHEIDAEILDDLYNLAFTDATNAALSWDATPPVGVAQTQHFESLKTVFNTGSNRIFQNTKRAVGNFAVVGTNVATVLESTSSFKPSNTTNVIGPHYLGDWGGFKVYKNPFYDPNNFVVGYKGSTMFDAGYVYAPYMPVMTTQMLMLDDFVGRQGWATMYGKKMLNNFMYVPGTITGLNNFIQG